MTERSSLGMRYHSPEERDKRMSTVWLETFTFEDARRIYRGEVTIGGDEMIGPLPALRREGSRVVVPWQSFHIGTGRFGPKRGRVSDFHRFWEMALA